MILGAIVGFLTGSASGLAGRSPWPSALWHACACALIAAVLVRWWGRVWLRSLRDALHERQRARPAPTPEPKAALKV